MVRLTGSGAAGDGRAAAGAAAPRAAGRAVAPAGPAGAAAGRAAGSAVPAGAETVPAGGTAARPGGPAPSRRDGGLRLRLALPAAVGGGLALAAAFPPAGIWPLAIAGPALLATALWRRGLLASLLVGLVFGAAFFFPLLSWLVNVAWYVWAALAVAESATFAVLAVGQRLLLRLRAWPVAVAGWWVGAEAVRARWPWGFPWGRLAMSQASSPAARWVAVGGAPLLTFLLALAGACLAWLLLAPPRPRPPRPGDGGGGEPRAASRRGFPAAAFGAAVVAALGGFLLPVDGQAAGTRTAVVATVQGDVPHARNLPGLLRATTVTADHARATRHLAAEVAAGSRPAPDVVIWPENSTDLDPAGDPFVYATILGAVDAVNRPVLVGAVLQAPLRNAGQLWLPRTGPAAIYVKRQLVPFGEVIPLRALLDKVTSLPSLQPVNFTPGRRAVVFRAGPVRIGDVICYEVAFDNLVSSQVRAGANLLTVQTNDADFELDGQTGETLQQLEIAQMRAIESNRAVVVSSTTGVSAIIAPGGSLLARSFLWRQQVLEARVPLRTSLTLADRLGGWPEAAITGATAAALAWVLGGAAGARSRARRSRISRA